MRTNTDRPLTLASESVASLVTAIRRLYTSPPFTSGIVALHLNTLSNMTNSRYTLDETLETTNEAGFSA